MAKPAQQIELPPPKHVHPLEIGHWYDETRHKPGLFLPLSVLWVISSIADRDGVANMEHIKSVVVNQTVLFEALNILGVLGYIRNEHAHIRIIHTPASKA